MLTKSLFEVAMLIAFGAAWPVSIRKSWLSKKNGSKSLGFLILIIAGYVFGLVKCALDPTPTHAMVYTAYSLNLLLVIIDTVLYVRNAKLEKLSSTS